MIALKDNSPFKVVIPPPLPLDLWEIALLVKTFPHGLQYTIVCSCPPHTNLALNLALDTAVGRSYFSTNFEGSRFAALGRFFLSINVAAFLSNMIAFSSILILSMLPYLESTVLV